VEVTGSWRKVHDEKIHNLCSVPNIMMFIKSRTLRWAGDVPRMEELRNAYRTVVGNLKGKDHSEDLGVDWRLILKWI